MSRIQLQDSGLDMIIKMSDGNPGAVVTLMKILSESATIDPQSVLGGIGPVLALDTLEVYGTDIYVLFNDKCDSDMRKFIMLLRAHQLGIITEELIRELAADQTRQVNLTEEQFDELDKKVCEQLVDFQKPKQETKELS